MLMSEIWCKSNKCICKNDAYMKKTGEVLFFFIIYAAFLHIYDVVLQQNF